MKVVALVLCVVAAANAGVLAPATTLVRTPSLDSAVIQSDRLGGNFAYSTVEAHSYAAVSPVVQNVVRPVGVSYTAHQVPVGVAYSAPAVVAARAAPVAVAAPAVAAPAVVAARAPVAVAAAPAVYAAPYAAHYAAPYAAHYAAPYAAHGAYIAAPNHGVIIA